MIFITHDLGAISKVADQLVVMNSGRLRTEEAFPISCIMRPIRIQDSWWKNDRQS